MPGLLLQPSTNYERALLQEALSELHWTASDEYYIVQWCKARDIDWQRVLRGEICANSLLVRTAVTRKAGLASLLKKADFAPETSVIDVDDFDDVAGAVEDVTEAVSSSGSQWVLKASEADRGDGVFFLDGARPRPEVEALVAAALGSSPQQQLWVIQRYVQRPLLLRGRKFHLRVMVLAVGDLAVYVHRNAVALFASDDFSAEDFSDKFAHATNHCVNRRREERLGDGHETQLSLTELFSALHPGDPAAAAAAEARAFSQLLLAARGVFSAAAALPPALGFCPLGNTFELFGADFLLDEDHKAWLLEVNGDPSLGVFGQRLRGLCGELLRDTLRVALGPSGVLPAIGLMTTSEHAGTGRFELAFERKPREAPEVGREKAARLMQRMGNIAAHAAGPAGGAALAGRPKRATVDPNHPFAEALGSALRRDGWEVSRDGRDPLCLFQYAAHKDIRWEKVMDGSTAVPSYFSHGPLLGRGALFAALSAADDEAASGGGQPGAPAEHGCRMPMTAAVRPASMPPQALQGLLSKLEGAADSQWHVETESALPAALAEAEQQASSRILSGRDAAAAVRELAAPGQPPGAGRIVLQQAVPSSRTVRALALAAGNFEVHLHRSALDAAALSGDPELWAKAKAAVCGALAAALRGSGGCRRLLPLPKSFELLCFTFAVGGGQTQEGGGGTESLWLLRVDPVLGGAAGHGATAGGGAETGALAGEIGQAAVLEGVLLGLARVMAGDDDEQFASREGGGGEENAAAAGFERIWVLPRKKGQTKDTS